MHGLEVHLARMHKLIEAFKPSVVVIDPISNLESAGTLDDSTNMLVRLIDFLRKKQITAFFVSLTSAGSASTEMTDEGMSSLVDTWLLVRDIELGGERNRAMYVLKSRGMAHSNQVREFLLTDEGIELRDVYLGTAGVLTGTARQVQETGEKAAVVVRAQEVQGLRRDLERKREVVEAKIMALRAESAAEMSEAETLISQAERSEALLGADRRARSELRKGDASKGERA